MLTVPLSSRIVFFFKQKTAYEMRISDWSSDVCSSDLRFDLAALGLTPGSDFVVQLSVTDNRGAGPQTTHSASYILRWPPRSAERGVGKERVSTCRSRW